MDLIALPVLPATPGEMLLRLAGPCARLGLDPHRVGSIRAAWLLAHEEHEQRERSLGEAVASLLGSRPSLRGSDEASKDAAREWREKLHRTQLELAEEACCWALPLDHPYGERLQHDRDGRPVERRPVEHWHDAAGVIEQEMAEARA